MTGPEHYREAERLVNLAQNSEVFQQSATALAQVHATLALAAATALAREGAKGAPQPSKDRAALVRRGSAECKKGQAA